MDILDLLEKICAITSISCFGLAGIGIVIRILCPMAGEEEKAKWIKNVPYTKLVEETIIFTGTILYNRNIKDFPRFQIRYYRHKEWAGVFNGNVVVYLKSNPDIPFLVNTVLHEVMHYIQSRTDRQYKRYGEYTDTYGYRNNPFEIEARAFAARHCEACLKYLESKQLIKKV